MLFKEAIEMFGLYLIGRDKAEETVKSYVGKVCLFSKYLNSVNIEYLNVDHTVASKYITQMTGKPSTKNAHILSLRPFYAWLVKFNHVQSNPFEEVKCLKNKKKLTDRGVIFPKEKLKRLLDVLSNPQKYHYSYHKKLVKRNYAMILFGSSIGLRRADYATLKLSDINFKNNSFRIIRKGSKDVVLPLEPKVSTALLDYINNERPSTASDELFVKINGSPLTIDGMGGTLKELLLKSGAEDIYCHSHSLRHFAGTEMIKRGIPLAYVQKLMSHENIATTSLYLHVTNEDANNAFMQGLK